MSIPKNLKYLQQYNKLISSINTLESMCLPESKTACVQQTVANNIKKIKISQHHTKYKKSP
jgi:hypothetical protein